MNSPNSPLPLNLNVGGFLLSEMDTLVSISQAPRLQATLTGNTKRSSNRIAMEDIPTGVFMFAK